MRFDGTMLERGDAGYKEARQTDLDGRFHSSLTVAGVE